MKNNFNQFRSFFVWQLMGFLIIVLSSLTGCSTLAWVNPEDTQNSRLDAPHLISSLEAFQRGQRAPADRFSPVKDVYFEFDRFRLSPEARKTLKVSAKWMREHSSAKILIEGHADNKGSNEYNLALAAKRADAVRGYLVDLGVTANRFSIVSYGEELPLCRDDTEECRGKNRRAHSSLFKNAQEISLK